jgi:hypothetical protein
VFDEFSRLLCTTRNRRSAPKSGEESSFILFVVIPFLVISLCTSETHIPLVDTILTKVLFA